MPSSDNNHQSDETTDWSEFAMAGDWIKWTKGLAKRREVIVLASKMGKSRHEIAGRLMELWEWCDDNVSGTDVDADSMNVSLNLGDSPFEFVDAILGLPGMAKAMSGSDVGWLQVAEQGVVTFPKLARHNGKSAKTRAYEQKKKQDQRSDSGGLSPVCPGESGTKSGLEKRREEKKNNSPPESSADGAAEESTGKKPSRPRKTPESTHHRTINAFCSRWELKYGARYPFNSGKDADAIKWILVQVGQDEKTVEEVFDRFFSDEDKFVVGNRHSMSILRGSFPKWFVQPGASGGNGNRVGPNGRIRAEPGKYAGFDEGVVCGDGSSGPGLGGSVRSDEDAEGSPPDGS